MPEEKSEIIFIVIVGTIILLTLALLIISLFIYYKKKQVINHLEKQQLQSQFSQTLLQSQIEIQEQTRRHISRELHDNLGQIASIIKINLNTITIEQPEKAIQKIEDSKELTRQLIADIKALSVSLNSDRIAKAGLITAIATEVERINKTEQFNAVFINNATNSPVDNDKAIILFRMVQEVLNNMVKHSQAKEITVTANSNENLFILALYDNGTGFSIEEKVNSGGQGLQNLQNRAALIHATFNIQSSPGAGTQVTIEVPI